MRYQSSEKTPTYAGVLRKVVSQKRERDNVESRKGNNGFALDWFSETQGISALEKEAAQTRVFMHSLFVYWAKQRGSQPSSAKLLEWFSVECRKTKTKVITLANHKEHTQYSSPIKTRGNYR